MKFSVICFAIVCSMPVIEARCKRRPAPAKEDPCGACNQVTIASSDDNGILIKYRLCEGGGPGVCDESQGRLEVYYNNQWGSVCDTNWFGKRRRFIENNADIACQMFGFPGGTATSMFGPAPAYFPIHLDNVLCAGGETSIAECPHDPWGVNGCVHEDDIGVVCFTNE